MAPQSTSGTPDMTMAVMKYTEPLPSRPTPHTGQANASEVMLKMIGMSRSPLNRSPAILPSP
jgi:hypothetical protein